MSLTDELEKLEQLRQNGVLDNSEFAQAKALLLSAGVQSNDFKKLNQESELARLDREWQLERQGFLIYGRYGRQRMPSISGIIGSVAGGLFGIVWTFLATSMFRGFSEPVFNGTNTMFPFDLIRWVFPLVGVCLTLYSIWAAFNEYNNLTIFERAELAYFQKRQQLL